LTRGRTITELAGENVVGKPDAELEWADNSERGRASLSVCKRAGDLDGKPHAFGISFVIDE
jgi:hypothetical protein